MSAWAPSATTGEGAQPPNLDWITPGLAVGGSFPATAVSLLARQGVRAVIDLRAEDRDDATLLAKHAIALLHLPTEDHAAVSQTMLDAGSSFALAQLAQGGRVLVHCREGIGRSVTLALCILAALDPERFGRDPIAAMRLIKDVRSYASPSPAQFEAWAAWLQRRGLPRPDFHAFAAVAYRHLHPA